MTEIHGITVRLWSKTQTGTDSLNEPVYEWNYEDVENVLVGQPTSSERLETLNLTGRMIQYVLGIPKGDTHDWENQIVEFFGHKFRTFDIPEQGIDDLVPTQWHLKVKVERYE